MTRRLLVASTIALLLAGTASAEELSAFRQSPPGMLIATYESDGGRNIPNFRFDKHHTAGGDYQITETNWQHYAPLAGIDLAVRPNALSATEQEQGMVAGLMWAKEGCLPWAPFNPKLASAGLCDLRGVKPTASAAVLPPSPITRVAAKSPAEPRRVKRHEWHNNEDDNNQQEDQVKQ